MKWSIYKCRRCKKWKVAFTTEDETDDWIGGIAGEFKTWREAVNYLYTENGRPAPL